MSHFSVLVVGENVKEQLAPYREKDGDNLPAKYLSFKDEEDEYLEKYNSDEKQSGSYMKEKHPNWCGKTWKEIYPTFEKYMADWRGYEERDPEKGRYGYWYNPNSKWDWYQVGGRWSNFFKLKPGTEGKHGELSWGCRDQGIDHKPGYADQAQKKDIDIEGMMQERLDKQLPDFDRAVEIIADRELPDWDTIRKKHGDDRIDNAREEYNSHQVVRDLKAADLWPFMEDIEEVYAGFDREAFIKKTREGALRTFAVLYNGKWYQRGEMGWFACVSDEEPCWHGVFEQLWTEIPDDALLTVVDCHI